MEVISLGLLALASGGLLAKARADKKAKVDKKEGFAATNDSLFGTVAQNTLPQAHKDFVGKTNSYFNPFASLLNINKTNLEFQSSNADASWTYSAPDNKTSANLFRSIYSKATPNGYGIDDTLGEKKATVYRVPSSTDIGGVINTCENTSVKTGDDLVADCSVFEGAFKNVCGICHGGVPGTTSSNVCSNSTGKPIITPAGLFVSSRLKSDPAEDELQMNALISGKNLQNMLVTPTLGTCAIDPKTNKNLFSLTSNTCVANNNYLKCAVGQGFGASKNCYACSTNGDFYFVDDANGKFSVRQPTTFTIGGNGTVNLQLLDVDGTTSLGFLSMPASGNILNLTSTSNTFALQPASNGMTPWQIALTSNGHAAAGKYLSITLNGTASVPYVQGQFQGALRSNSKTEYTDFAKTAFDITSGTSDNVFYESSSYGMKLEPAVVRGSQGIIAKFKVLIPYLYINTSNIEANYCAGPYVVNANSRELLSNSPCYASNSAPGNYNIECLKRVFISGGCTAQGSGYPSDSNKANVLMSRARDRVGSNADQGQIARYVYSEYKRSWSGLDSNGVQLSASNWNASQKFCTNSNAVIINPCDNLPPYIKENGPLSDECIKYIYTSGYTDDSNNGTYSTYSGKPDAASLFGATEPFIGSSKKDRWCTEFGGISPLAGGSNMVEAKGKGGIATLKNFYNNIHSKANQTNMTNAERAQYVAQCYGTTMNIEGDADPTEMKGMQTSVTNCGTGGLTSANRTSAQDQGNIVGTAPIGNIRFVRVYGNDNNDYIQISQLVVLDSRGQNLALKKNTSYSSLYTGSISNTPVDGTLSIRDFPNIYHSGTAGPNEFYEVDLGGLYDIVQIIYFNRNAAQARAVGMRIYLYNNETATSGTPRTKNNARYVTSPLTAAPVQYINFANPNGDPSCPKMLSGQRGDLLAGQATNNGIRNNVEALTTELDAYSIYNLPLTSDMSLSLGGDNESGGTPTTAKWIWNHPYAGQNAVFGPVGFYTNIYNSKNIQQNYYLYYRCDDSVTSIIFNGVSIPSVPGGAYTGNIVGSKILLVALPGQNLLQVVCNNIVGRACFIAAIYGGGSWISGTDAEKTNYYSATNTVSTAGGGYSWRSYNAPNIGTVFQNNATNYMIHRITEKPSSWNQAATNGMQWIWNQPDAGRYAEAGNVGFYINFNVTAITVVYYKLFFACDDAITSFTINGMTVPSTSINSSATNVNFVTFQVVFGTNSLEINVGNYGNNPAGFKGYIVDNSDNFVAGTQTDSENGSLWKCTTETQWTLGTACVYVPNNGMTYNCASNIWGSNCNQGFTNAIFTGSPVATNGAGLDNYNKSNMGAQLNDHWGLGSRARGVTDVEKARQTSCRGTTVCPPGKKYNSSGVFSEKCTPNGVADDAVCRNGYRYDSTANEWSFYCKSTSSPGTVTQIPIFTTNDLTNEGVDCPSDSIKAPGQNGSGSRYSMWCISKPLTGYITKNPNVNCGYKVGYIRFTSTDYIQISRIALYDVYGNDLTQNGCTVTAANSYWSDRNTQTMANRIITNPLRPVTGDLTYICNRSAGSYIEMVFSTPQDAIALVYYNRSDGWNDRARSMKMEIYKGKNIIAGTNILYSPLYDFPKFTDGLVQTINLSAEMGIQSCQPYYNNCPPTAQTRQADGSCIGINAPINFTSAQF